MITKFDKFLGRVKESLDKEEVIDLVSLITEMKPEIQMEVDNSDISKLIDNINHYNSEDGKWSITVYFRESDIYRGEDGAITHGNFKTLFKITIKKIEGDSKVGELKEFVGTFRDIIKVVYPDTIIKIKIGDKKMEVSEFTTMSDDKTLENIKLIIRIL